MQDGGPNRTGMELGLVRLVDRCLPWQPTKTTGTRFVGHERKTIKDIDIMFDDNSRRVG